MRRREFIALLGGAAAAWPLAARAQQPTGRLAWIGLLIPVSATSAANNIRAMREGLRDLGYIEGQNIAIEYRYTDGRDDLHAGFAAELVRRKVDVIVTWGTQSARAAKQATCTIPIVMAAIADPIGTGIVSNLARPGENVTGLSSTALDIEAKRLELLKEVVPKAARIGVFWNPGNPVSSLILKQTQAAAKSLGLELVPVGVRIADEFTEAFATMSKAGPDALSVQAEVVLLDRKARILQFAAERLLPAIYGYREFAEAGGLIFYGPSWPHLFRRSATYIDKILKGAKPADLPIEQPTKFELVINLKTAKVLGLTIPQSLLATADEVIE